mmetsp:Transcript_27595/g.40612  ORF Transcript_27595/g.40612 Transcript_27595/m.40612 type:complete len:152 (-) Transcript_27595:1691-2146(-)
MAEEIQNDTQPSSQQQQTNDIVLPTYIMKPDENEKFYPSQVKQIAQDVLKDELDGKIDERWMEEWVEYNTADDFESLSKDIADKIKTKCKNTLNLPRYKLIVQVTIGQKKDQGVSITSRCLWDTSTDNYASVSYQDAFIWASALVFGLYIE